MNQTYLENLDSKTRVPLLAGRFLKSIKDWYKKGGAMFEDVVDQYGFVPLKIEGLFELDRYLINDRGFVMIAKKNKRKTKGRLLLPRPDKDGFMYVTLRTLEGKREPFYVDYLLHNNNTKYRSFNL